MLPPLNQLADTRAAAEAAGAAGPSRDALHRPSAPTPTTPSVRPAGVNSHRRVSAAKPPPPAASSSSSSAAATAAFSSPRRATYRPSILSPRIPMTSAAADCDVQPITPGGTTGTAIETISRVPREFFVVETNAVLPVTQYPPAQYQSTFVGSGAWETVVFPALTPHTRQQVLCLRQALETMRVRAAAAAAAAVVSPTEGSAAGASPAPTAMLTVEYTEKEWALHSLCFHELARQIKFICREQSELLFEIQAAYDASVARLASLVRQQQERLDAQHTLVGTLHEQLRVAKEDAERTLTNQHDAESTACACGRRDHSRRRSPRRRGGSDDDDDEDDEAEHDDEDEDEWRAFQRQRRLRMREFARHSDADAADDDDDSDSGGGRGRLQRASIVEENTAAARVQQAFAKYQQRKEAARQLQRQEKKGAALDIQRSYRGYRERKRALHHRAVMHTILKRRKQVAAVELLQMNVRAYLIKKRREGKNGVAGDDDAGGPTTAHASMIEAQRAATLEASGMTATTQAASSNEARDSASPTPAPSEQDASASDRFVQLLNSMSELAAAFSFLHSRRRNAKNLALANAAKATAEAATTPTASASGDQTAPNVVVEEERDESTGTRDAVALEAGGLPDELKNATVPPVQDEQAEEASADAAIDDAERALLDATIRRAESLVLSFKSVINDLRQGDESLTRATSTTTLEADGEGAVGPLVSRQKGDNASSVMDALGSAALLFLDDDDDANNAAADSPSGLWPSHGRASPVAPEGEAALVSGRATSPFDDNDDEDDSDATHLDDVLWQAAVFTPASAEDRADEASARQLLMRELLASRDQQKRLAALKQFIADIYDTIVGRLRELPRARLEKLVRVHGSLALSFADGRRLLRLPRRHASMGATANEYEPVTAFVGRLELKALIQDHFHCQVGLKHLVDAASERVAGDLRHFMGIDADVQRFHEYLMHDRSLEDLVFFCLCRLFAREAGDTRQPVFHRATLRELVDARCAVEIATRFFHASGDDASMAETDAFVIEPTNEIYACHLPSKGLEQLDAILRGFVSPVDDSDLQLCLDEHVRATNASQFHAPEYNASAPRSPLRRQRPDAAGSPPNWLFFAEFVDLLRRYRSVMRHFHAFVQWTYELFHEAFRQQRQQQLLLVDAGTAGRGSTGAPLLEEAAFVATLLPYSRGASDRELRNVFHNALKQRALQRLMPVRVFVSVVLVLLRNGLLSVTSYKPLVTPVGPSVVAAKKTSAALTDASYLGSHRRQREEKQWVQLALQWRAQEQRFEATIERLYAASGGTGGAEGDEGGGEGATEPVAEASRLLQWRNELYELFMLRAGREHLERARTVYEQLAQGLTRGDDDAVGGGSVPETDDDGEHQMQEEDGKPCRAQDDGAAAAVGSPWATDTNQI